MTDPIAEPDETQPLLDSSPSKEEGTPAWYIAYYIPSLNWMRNYKWSYLPGDIAGGLTLASFQIPISLSYATSLAHVKPVAGLYGLVVPPVVYAFFGSVPQMVVAPEAAISLIVGQTVVPYLEARQDDDHHHHGGRHDLSTTQVSSLISGSVGAVVLMLGLIRAGFLESIVAPSLLRGFITGVGLIMVTDQIPAQLGIAGEMHRALGPEASSYHKFVYTINHWRDANSASAIFAFCALAAILSFKIAKHFGSRRWKHIMLVPEILIVVVISTIVSYAGDFEKRGLLVVGDVRPGHVELDWMLRPKYWSDFRVNFSSSFFIAILGFLESTVAARSLGCGDDMSVSSNRELVALGLVNILGSTVNALPSFGGYGRSKINMLSGARTQVSAIVVSLVTLFAMYNLMGYLYFLPKCVLSSIITNVGLTLLEEAPSDIRFYVRVKGWSDLATIMLSIVTTFFWSVEAGVGLGAFFALIRVLHHATRPRIQILTRYPGSHEFVNADDMPDMPPGTHDIDSGILIVKVPEPLTFANSGDLSNRLRRLELHRTSKVHPGRPRTAPEVLHHVIFHLKGMTQCDAGAAATLHDIVENYISRKIVVLFTDVSPKKEIRDLLESSGILKLINDAATNGQAVFDNLDQAIATFDN